MKNTTVEKYTLGKLAEDCGLIVSDLALPIKHIADFHYDSILPSLENENEDGASTFHAKEIFQAIKAIKGKDIKAKQAFEISKPLYDFVKNQYIDSLELVSVSEISKDNNLDPQQVRLIIRQWFKTKRYIFNNYFVTNIFKSTKHHFVSKSKVNVFVQLILIQIAVENRLQSGWVYTNDVAYATRSKHIQVSLMEQVQDPNSTKGRVIAFGKLADHNTYPIIRWYNGSISFAKNLQHSPRTSGNLGFKSLKQNKRVCSFIFPLSEITNQKTKKRNIQLFNIFLKALQGKPVEIRVSLKDVFQAKANNNYGRVLIKINPTRLSTENITFDPNDSQGIKAEKEKAYGSNGATNEELTQFLQKFADENTKTYVHLSKAATSPIYINSTSYTIVTYLRDRQTYDLLHRRAEDNNLSIGDYIRSLSDLNTVEAQLSDYQSDKGEKELKDKVNLEKRIGKHFLKQRDISYKEASYRKANVKSYLIKNNVPTQVVDTILNDPVTCLTLDASLEKPTDEFED